MSDTMYGVLRGDPSVLRDKAKRYVDLATAIASSKAALTTIADDTAVSSDAMTQLRELAANVRDDIAKTHGLYQKTGDALHMYAGELDTAKSVADPAAAEIARLEEAVFYAQISADNANGPLEVAKWRLRYASPDATPEEMRHLNSAVTSAQAALNKAKADLESKQHDLAYQKRRWTNEDGHGGGKERKDVSAAKAADAIKGVFDTKEVNGLEDSFWEKVKGAWDSIYKIISTICDIASFLSLFLAWVPGLGQVLLVLATIGKILAIVNTIMTLADSVIKFASGEMTLGSFLGAVALGAVNLFADKLLGAAGKKISGMGVKLGQSSNFGKLFAGELKSPFTKWTASASDKIGYQFIRSSVGSASGFGGKSVAIIKGMGSSFLMHANLKFPEGSTGSAIGDSAMNFLFGKQANAISKAFQFGDTGLGNALALAGFSMASQGNAVYNFTKSTAGAVDAFKKGDIWGGIGGTVKTVASPFGGNWGTLAGGVKTAKGASELGSDWGNMLDAFGALFP